MTKLLMYRPARLHRLAESIPGLHERLQIRALNVKFIEKSVIMLKFLRIFCHQNLIKFFNFWVFPDDAEPLGQHTGSRHGKRHRVIPAHQTRN
jgi:hypothetical protein